MSNSHDAVLLVLADALDDLEAIRIATEGRIRSLQQVKSMEGTPAEADMLAVLDGLKGVERRAIRDLERAMRAHPLAGFIAAHDGIGEKSVGRLLAVIGDPASRENPAKLWQYCGCGDPARSRLCKDALTYDENGRHRLPFNPRAKTLTWQIAESASRQGHYRQVYVAAREACADKVHAVECRNTNKMPKKPNGCSRSEHPEWGAVGSPWRDGHKHAHALRIIRKTFLLDLWKYARDLPDEN